MGRRLLENLRTEARRLMIEWRSKQGPDKCWYCPEIFNSLCDVLGVDNDFDFDLNPRSEFEQGCKQYQDQLYGSKSNEL